jgi:chromosome segregation ATPase
MLELLFKFEYEIPDLDIALANAFFPGLNLSEGATYFHLCAGLGNIEILEYFHEIHPDSLLNAIDNMGNTPLHVAVKCKQIDSVEWLLEQTLSPWMINHNDFSPIDISNELGHKAISKVLIQNARFERIEKNQFINTLESEIQTLENTLSGQSETLIDNQNLRVRVSALESFEKKYSEISETLIESTNRITELESIISDIEEKRSQKESELLSMTNAWLDKKEAVNLKEEEILKMNQSIEELVSLLQSANECLTRMRENEQQLLQITEKAEAAFEGAERRYRKIESDLIETEKQVQAWESQVLDLRSQLNQRKANKEIVRLKYELAEQSGEAEQLKIENKDLLANNTHFRREKVEAESLLSESDQKNKALQGDLAKLTEYMKALGYNPEEILESNVDKMKIRPRTSTLFQ